MSAPVDVLRVMEGAAKASINKLAREQIRAARQASKLGRRDEAADFRVARLAENVARNEEALAAVAELIEAGTAILPRGVCLANTNVPDSEEVPLLATMGELRAFAAALARVGGAA